MHSILFVDDNHEARAAMEELLILAGYVVFGAGSGAEGLELLNCCNFDLVITDMKMPDLDGNQFVDLLSGLVNPPPVIVLTGNIFSVTPNPLIKEVAYKPIPINNLLTLVENILYPVEQEMSLHEQPYFVSHN